MAYKNKSLTSPSPPAASTDGCSHPTSLCGPFNRVGCCCDSHGLLLRRQRQQQRRQPTELDLSMGNLEHEPTTPFRYTLQGKLGQLVHVHPSHPPGSYHLGIGWVAVEGREAHQCLYPGTEIPESCHALGVMPSNPRFKIRQEGGKRTAKISRPRRGGDNVREGGRKSRA